MFKMPQKSSVKKTALYAVLFAVLLASDLITKNIVIQKLMVGRTMPVIENVLHFTYVRNTGAAFGIFRDSTVFLTGLSVVVLAAMGTVLYKIRPVGNMVLTSACMIFAGAAGNIADRIRFGYVVDFIDVRLINFAVFNLADCFVCIGAVILAVYVIFKKE